MAKHPRRPTKLQMWSLSGTERRDLVALQRVLRVFGEVVDLDEAALDGRTLGVHAHEEVPPLQQQRVHGAPHPHLPRRLQHKFVDKSFYFFKALGLLTLLEKILNYVYRGLFSY